MLIPFALFVGLTVWAETTGNPIHHALGLAGPNMEGKEVRFGATDSAIWAGGDHGRIQRLGQCHA